jgi:hypothetical protein
MFYERANVSFHEFIKPVVYVECMGFHHVFPIWEVHLSIPYGVTSKENSN